MRLSILFISFLFCVSIEKSLAQVNKISGFEFSSTADSNYSNIKTIQLNNRIYSFLQIEDKNYNYIHTVKLLTTDLNGNIISEKLIINNTDGKVFQYINVQLSGDKFIIHGHYGIIDTFSRLPYYSVIDQNNNVLIEKYLTEYNYDFYFKDLLIENNELFVLGYYQPLFSTEKFLVYIQHNLVSNIQELDTIQYILPSSNYLFFNKSDTLLSFNYRIQDDQRIKYNLYKHDILMNVVDSISYLSDFKINNNSSLYNLKITTNNKTTIFEYFIQHYIDQLPNDTLYDYNFFIIDKENFKITNNINHIRDNDISLKSVNSSRSLFRYQGDTSFTLHRVTKLDSNGHYYNYIASMFINNNKIFSTPIYLDSSSKLIQNRFFAKEIFFDEQSNTITTYISDFIEGKLLINRLNLNGEIINRMSIKLNSNYAQMTYDVDAFEKNKFMIFGIAKVDNIQTHKYIIEFYNLLFSGTGSLKFNQILIAPNPNYGSIYLKNYHLEQEDRINIYNINGQKLDYIRVNDTQIDLVHHHEGMYILEIITKQNTYRSKILAY